VSARIETAAGEMAVGKTPCVGALVSVGIETPSGEMAVGKTPPSRGSGECRDRDGGWRDGCQQDATQ